MLLFLTAFTLCFGITNAKHITILLDTAIPKHNVKAEQESREALKYAYSRYLLPQDHLTLITFDHNKGVKVLDNVLISRRETIFQKIDQIPFTIGCADWTAGLKAVTLGSTSKTIYLITDENPCKSDPTDTAQSLKDEGYEIFAIGIGKGVDRAWLKKIGQKTKWIEAFHFVKHRTGRRTLTRGHTRMETTEISTGEIIAASIVGAIIVVLLLVSCVFACRQERRVKRVKRKIKSKLPL